MDMKQLFEDFKRYVANLTDEEIKTSLQQAIEHSQDEPTKDF